MAVEAVIPLFLCLLFPSIRYVEIAYLLDSLCSTWSQIRREN
jgi:hypothetical protein